MSREIYILLLYHDWCSEGIIGLDDTLIYEVSGVSEHSLSCE